MQEGATPVTHAAAATHAQPVNAQGRPICGARTRSGRRGLPTCQNTALGQPAGTTGMRRCRMHGGFAKVGLMSPSATAGGRYSRHLPKALRGAFDLASADPSVLSLRADVALVTARIELALQGLDGGAAIVRTLDRWAAFEAALKSGQPTAIVGAADGMRGAVAALGDQRFILRDIERLQLLKAKLSLVESRRQIAAATMLDAASAWALVSSISELVRTHVSDPVSRRAIAEGLARLTRRGALPRPE